MTAWAKNIVLTIGSIVACLLALEAVLNFLPVTDSLLLEPVTRTQPVPHYKSNREIITSSGWNFARINHGHVNNYGFVNNQDYESDGDGPLLAVVGDSYVEARMVPFEGTLQARLATDLSGRARVYSFGISGAPLSTYLVFARFARDTFHPDGLIVVVIGNDFDESLLEYKSDPPLTYFEGGDGQEFTLKTVPYRPSLMTRSLRKSALARYLAYNLKLKGLILGATRPAAGDQERPNYVSNTSASFTAEKLEFSRRAVDVFLDRLPEFVGLQSDRILFVVDAIRPQIYGAIDREVAEASYFQLMRNYFTAAARIRGYEVADMHRIFESDFTKNGRRFEFSDDDHWSAVGHGVAADAVRKSQLYSLFAAAVPRE